MIGASFRRGSAIVSLKWWCAVTPHVSRLALTPRPKRFAPIDFGAKLNFARKVGTMSVPPAGIAGLDRKKMEEERLERNQNKRGLDQAPEPEAKLAKLDSGEAVIARVSSSKESDSKTTIAKEATTNVTSNLEFPYGALRKTWAFGHPRHNDIKIEEVLKKDELKTAVISSYNWDFDWFVSKFNLKTTKFILAMQARNDAEKRHFMKEFEGLSKIRLCFPPLSGNAYACMHSKLMLLFYPQHLRVVVPSANFVPYDWGEGGIMENSVFLIDLPRLPEENHGHGNTTLNDFARELLRFADAMTLDDDVKLGILNFDFTGAQEMSFVHTIGGTHTGRAAIHTGLPGLSRAIRTMHLQTSDEIPLEVDMAASSVATINNDTINRVYNAVHGTEEKVAATTKKKDASSMKVKEPTRFRIIFPSRETVSQSTGGPQNGGTIFLKADVYKRAQFPAKQVRNYKSRRQGLLSHNKLIFVRSPTNAFFYMGSANLSHAAWGTLSYDKETKGPKLTANNWECGVLIPVVRDGARVGLAAAGDKAQQEETKTSESGVSSDVLPTEVFESVLGMPWRVPAPEYSSGQLPWHPGG